MAALSSQDGLIPSAISSASLSADDVAQALSSTEDANEQAALCIYAGTQRFNLADVFWALMDDDSLLARCACWALGQSDAQTFIIKNINDASLDQREQSYHCLSYIIARGAQQDGLEAFLSERIDQELERVKQGKTGLGEHVCRNLAMIASAQSEDAIKRVTSEDQYSDRFELQRLRKASADGNADEESLEHYKQSWQDIFADDCADEITEAEETIEEQQTDAPEVAEEHTPEANAEEMPEEEGVEQNPEAIQIIPIDWEGFLASEEAAAIEEKDRSIVTQIGPMFEQLAAQALGKNFAELNSQELMVMVLQILPQAIPPEYMQAALSPQSLNGLQCLARFLNNTGVATEGEELEIGIRQIREQIQQQIRASGSLHSGDYDEPEFLSASTDGE